MHILYECEVAHLLFDEEKRKSNEIFFCSAIPGAICTHVHDHDARKRLNIDTYTHNRFFFSLMHTSCFMLTCHLSEIYGNVRCYSLIKVCRFIFRNLFFCEIEQIS